MDEGPLVGGTFLFIQPEIEWVKVSTYRTSFMYPHHVDLWIKIPLQVELPNTA